VLNSASRYSCKACCKGLYPTQNLNKDKIKSYDVVISISYPNHFSFISCIHTFMWFESHIWTFRYFGYSHWGTPLKWSMVWVGSSKWKCKAQKNPFPNYVNHKSTSHRDDAIGGKCHSNMISGGWLLLILCPGYVLMNNRVQFSSNFQHRGLGV
jgi:hypothetical protein